MSSGGWVKKSRNRSVGLTVLVLLVLVAAVLIIIIKSQDKYKIPTSISNQLDFPVLFLKNPTPKFTIETSSIKYAAQPDGSKVFSFILFDGRDKITFSEQAYPEVLIYDKFTNSLNPYSEVGTLYGKATLGRPKDAGGKQVAGLKYTDSTLIFAQPEQDLTDFEWTSIFNALDTLR